MRADINVHSKQSHMTGVQFPITDEALAKLANLNEKKISLVQLVSETVVYTLSGLKTCSNIKLVGEEFGDVVVHQINSVKDGAF